MLKQDKPCGFEAAFAAWNRQALRPHVLLDASTNGTMRTRFGGASLGKAPLDTSGRPMRMLCAVDFSELPMLPDFPQTGLLRIYVKDDALFGMDYDEPTAQRDFRVLYDADGSGLMPQEEPGESDYFPIPLCCPCRAATLERQPIPYGNYRFDEPFSALLRRHGVADIDGEMECRLTHARELQQPAIGGYAWFTQDDPRTFEKKWQRYDTLLLQIPYRDEPDAMFRIGDGGVINFLIPHEKLKKRDFSDVLFWWDCY